MLLLSISEAKIEMTDVDAFFSWGIQPINAGLERGELSSGLIEELWWMMVDSGSAKNWWRDFVRISCDKKFQNIGKHEAKEWWKIMRNICLTAGVQSVPVNKIKSMMVLYPKKSGKLNFLK